MGFVFWVFQRKLNMVYLNDRYIKILAIWESFVYLGVVCQHETSLSLGLISTIWDFSFCKKLTKRL